MSSIKINLMVWIVLINRGSGGGGVHNHGQQLDGTGFGGNGGSGVVIVGLEDTSLVTNTSMTLISDTFG